MSLFAARELRKVSPGHWVLDQNEINKQIKNLHNLHNSLTIPEAPNSSQRQPDKIPGPNLPIKKINHPMFYLRAKTLNKDAMLLINRSCLRKKEAWMRHYFYCSHHSRPKKAQKCIAHIKELRRETNQWIYSIKYPNMFYLDETSLSKTLSRCLISEVPPLFFHHKNDLFDQL